MKKDIVYEVVCSQHYLDVGLLVEKDSKSKPKRIRARSSTYSYRSEYGGVGYVTWINTGVFLSEKEWDEITYNKPTDQILKELGIVKSNNHAKPIKVERVNMKNYELIAELSKYPAGAEVSFECLCDSSEVDIQEDSDDGEVYVVSKKICSVDMDNGRVMLS